MEKGVLWGRSIGINDASRSPCEFCEGTSMKLRFMWRRTIIASSSSESRVLGVLLPSVKIRLAADRIRSQNDFRLARGAVEIMDLTSLTEIEEI